ncbi:MAG: DNA primase [Verrucomicrobia bacterium]|nr:DNA primase [Verrucomicrobiota bacterium]
MALYSKESLEALRQRIDLVDVVSSYVKMQRSGSSYKGLCPFHDEKTPSFLIHKGDTHYHCFGSGAHGDSIAFLMNYAKMTFVDSLEFLSERFQVPLEKTKEEEKGPNKGRLKQVLERACLWYQFFLIHTEEGHEALNYLYARGLSLKFIRTFEIGYAPKLGGVLHRLLKEEGFSDEEMFQAGLIRQGSSGRCKDFFSERIAFPIKDRMGAVIGFSARKFKEETFGGKYINTAETMLFKKSHVLFGFCYSRQTIAKTRKALIVEGQIDALRLIDSGFDFTVAGQGTAFGEGHAKELLQLGVTKVYLALDGDKAGAEATIKIGDLFQSKGVEVIVVSLTDGLDPDAFLRSYGKEAFETLLSQGLDYLTFYYRYLSKGQDLSSPSQKNNIIETIAQKVRLWEQPVMVYESLKKLASMAGVPEDAVKIGEAPKPLVRKESLIKPLVDPDKRLETDLLRWMMLSEEKSEAVFRIVNKNITLNHFKVESCSRLFSAYQSLEPEERKDLLPLASLLETPGEQELLQELLQRKVNVLKAEEGVIETVKKMLTRSWMELGDEILKKMQDAPTLEEAMELSKQFDELKKQPPIVLMPEEVASEK